MPAVRGHEWGLAEASGAHTPPLPGGLKVSAPPNPPQIPHCGFLMTAPLPAGDGNMVAQAKTSRAHTKLTPAGTVAPSHWKDQGHQRPHFSSNWFNPTHLAFHDPANHVTVMPARIDIVYHVVDHSLHDAL